jgi:hypothetical protein
MPLEHCRRSERSPRRVFLVRLSQLCSIAYLLYVAARQIIIFKARSEVDGRPPRPPERDAEAGDASRTYWLSFSAEPRLLGDASIGERLQERAPTPRQACERPDIGNHLGHVTAAAEPRLVESTTMSQQILVGEKRAPIVRRG